MSLPLAGLLLALSAALPPVATTGSGSVRQVVGDPSFVSWMVGSDAGSDVRTVTSAPFRCTATCDVDFSRVVSNLPVAFRSGFTIVPRFEFTGPVVRATARQTCVGCAPQGQVWVTDWAATPFTMTGTLTFIDQTDPQQRTIFEIVGAGTATASSYYEVMQGPWNYATVQWDFTYTVVPEPSALLLSASGVLLLLCVVGRRRHGAGR